MVQYLIMRIERGILKYEDVVKKYPEYKQEIDKLLKQLVLEK